MNRFLFKRDGVGVMPWPPTDTDPDGIDLCSLEDAAAVTGIDEEKLRQRWLKHYGDYQAPRQPPLQQPVPTEPTSVAAPPAPVGPRLTFTVGTRSVFQTFVVADHLIDKDGNPAMGYCLPNQKRILISSHFPSDTWEETWHHEARHAWHSASPRPKNDEEAANDWEGTVSRESHAQFRDQNGLDKLMAMEPASGLSPAEIVRAPGKSLTLDRLLRIKFRHLNEEQFEMAMQSARARKLDPWRDHFYVRLVRRSGRMEPKLILTIEGMRTMARRSPHYGGHELPVYTYDTQVSRYPRSCVFVSIVKVNGEDVRVPAEAFWSDAYGDDPLKIDSVVLAKPLVCLAIVAEGMSLRMAYPDECGDIYTAEEFKKPIEYREAARTAPGCTPLPAITLDAPNDHPASADGMRARLKELGFKTNEQQRDVVRRTEAEYGVCQDGLEVEFYAQAIAIAKAS